MRVVWFDLETGGLEPRHPDIQLAAVATDDFIELAHFEAKIRFDESKADPEALKLNHYDPAVWKEHSKTEMLVVAEFAEFLRAHSDVKKVSQRTGSPYMVARIAGHNAASFDAPRLQAMFRRHNAFLPADSFRTLDTLQLALWHQARTGAAFRSFKLGELCEDLGIETIGAHDALADVRMCVKLARAIIGSAG